MRNMVNGVAFDIIHSTGTLKSLSNFRTSALSNPVYELCTARARDHRTKQFNASLERRAFVEG